MEKEELECWVTMKFVCSSVLLLWLPFGCIFGTALLSSQDLQCDDVDKVGGVQVKKVFSWYFEMTKIDGNVYLKEAIRVEIKICCCT